MSSVSRSVGRPVSRSVLAGQSTNLTQLIKALFTAGEQGFAYDPNDLTTLYQDVAGTIPVTAAGQPVGLMLDKSKGLVLGEELWTNPIPTILDSVETLGTYNQQTMTFSNPIAATVAARPLYRFTFDWAANKSYLVKGKFKSGFDKLYLNVIRFGATTGYSQISVNQLTGEFSAIATSTDNQVSIIYTAGKTGDIVLDFISIKEVKGNHAYQSVSASRPILQRNATTGAYYLAFDGIDDFLQTNSIDFTATDKVSLFAGVRKLSDAVAALVEFSTNSYATTQTFGLISNHADASKNYLFRSSGSILCEAFTLNNSFPSPISNVLTATSSISGDSLKLKVDGRLEKQSTQDQGTGNYGNYPLYIGRRGGVSLPFNGHLYGLIGIGRLTTDSETKALEKAIAKNMGVTLNV